MADLIFSRSLVFQIGNELPSGLDKQIAIDVLVSELVVHKESDFAGVAVDDAHSVAAVGLIHPDHEKGVSICCHSLHFEFHILRDMGALEGFVDMVHFLLEPFRGVRAAPVKSDDPFLSHESVGDLPVTQLVFNLFFRDRE